MTREERKLKTQFNVMVKKFFNAIVKIELPNTTFKIEFPENEKFEQTNKKIKHTTGAKLFIKQ